MSDPTLNAALPPVLPTKPAAAPVPEAGAVAPAESPVVTTAVPAITQDTTAAAADVQFHLTDVNIDNLDYTELVALDGIMQNMLSDGKLSQEELKLYDKTRVFYAKSG